MHRHRSSSLKVLPEGQVRPAPLPAAFAISPSAAAVNTECRHRRKRLCTVAHAPNSFDLPPLCSRRNLQITLSLLPQSHEIRPALAGRQVRTDELRSWSVRCVRVVHYGPPDPALSHEGATRD